jgi:hypothetical protein
VFTTEAQRHGEKRNQGRIGGLNDPERALTAETPGRTKAKANPEDTEVAEDTEG